MNKRKKEDNESNNLKIKEKEPSESETEINNEESEDPKESSNETLEKQLNKLGTIEGMATESSLLQNQNTTYF